MAKPSEIRDAIAKFCTSVVWVQEWGFQDPLKESPIIDTVKYPSNCALQLPSGVFKLEIEKEFADGSSAPLNRCLMELPFRIIYIFPREDFPTYRSLPIQQIENLYTYLSLVIQNYAQTINEDILFIDIPEQSDFFTVRPAEQVRSQISDSNEISSWAVVFRVLFEVSFLVSLEEFTFEDFNKIQPQTFPSPDEVDQVEFDFSNFVINGLNIDVYRSELPNVRPNEPDTYKLDERIEIRKSGGIS